MSFFDNNIVSQVVDGDIDDGLNYHSKGNLNELYSFKIDNNSLSEWKIKYLEECSNKLYGEILVKLNNLNFKSEWINIIIQKRKSNW